MTNSELVEKALDIAHNYKTAYVWGAFGWPMTKAAKDRIIAEYSYNREPAHKAAINMLSPDTFGFDCVNLIKAILWGWNGDKSKNYGGAKYDTKVCPDIGANTMITKCNNVKTSGWETMTPGEVVWLSGHIGIYVGDSLVVEATPRWSGGVQVSALGNIGGKPGYNSRTWSRHGFLPYITYVTEPAEKPKNNKIAMGDIVSFTGDKHYVSPDTNTGYKARPGMAKVTIIRENAKHPYHVIHTDKQSNVYGWVDKKAVTK